MGNKFICSNMPFKTFPSYKGEIFDGHVVIFEPDGCEKIKLYQYYNDWFISSPKRSISGYAPFSKGYINVSEKYRYIVVWNSNTSLLDILSIPLIEPNFEILNKIEKYIDKIDMYYVNDYPMQHIYLA